MSELFREKYRVKTTRLKNWNYASSGYYFVTICTKNREDYFGEIKNGIMRLNKIGCITTKFWQEIPKRFSNVKLNSWVVMPNHVHGVIIINNPRRDRINPVSTTPTHTTPTHTTTDDMNNWKNGFTKTNNPMRQKTLGRFIRWFKGRTAFEIRKHHNTEFSWQPRYYDHIIHDNNSLNNIQNYIRYNPQKWITDRNNSIPFDKNKKIY